MPRSSRIEQIRISEDTGINATEFQRQGCAMKGIHFAALSAPGQSGVRPEHIKECLSISRRHVNKLLMDSLNGILDAATGGNYQNRVDGYWTVA